MKNLLKSLFAAYLLGIFIVGCASNDTNPATPYNTNSQHEKTENTDSMKVDNTHVAPVDTSGLNKAPHSLDTTHHADTTKKIK